MANAVKWSYTAVNTLRECNRKFLFAQVLATHGRKDALRRKAYELKNMQTLTMWKGSVVDKFMETVIIPMITRKEALDFNELAEQAVALAKRQFSYSKHGIYKEEDITKGEVGADFCILDIHVLGREYTETDLAEVYSTVREAILRMPEITMPSGELLIAFLKTANALLPNVNNWVVYIENALVKPQIDLIAYQQWKPVIIDWKLSESFTADYSRQLIICGLTVYLKRLEKTDKKPYDYSDIKLFEVNLLKGVVKEHAFASEEINNITDYINLTSRDITLLMDKSAGIDFDDFELTDNEASCKLCNYRTLCSYMLLNDNNYDEESYTEFVQNNQLAGI